MVPLGPVVLVNTDCVNPESHVSLSHSHLVQEGPWAAAYRVADAVELDIVMSSFCTPRVGERKIIWAVIVKNMCLEAAFDGFMFAAVLKPHEPDFAVAKVEGCRCIWVLYDDKWVYLQNGGEILRQEGIS
jgi:hypothetical protein